jgi:hypothetical protein
MLVYGDRSERADPSERLDAVDRDLRQIESLPPGGERHARLRNALIETGRLLQGVADAEFAIAECDRPSEASDAIGDLLLLIAQALCRSWSNCFQGELRLPTVPHGLSMPGAVELKVPEGYSFYAVYPEAYAQAARSLELRRDARVIGIRSIGASLAAMTAAAIGAPRPVTMRPFGPPYERRIALSDELAQHLLDAGDADFLIVDEGPGQSGSSFGGVADWLEAHGVAEDRIIVLPSHGGGPGPQASERHRQRWSRARSVVADFSGQIPALLAAGTKFERPPVDISGGQWRQHVFPREEDWPAVVAAWEPRKYLVHADGLVRLYKFAGLGDAGRRKLERARKLGAFHFVPQAVGLVHGFLVEEWLKEAEHLASDAKPLNEVARYIGVRARLLPARANAGASLETLFEMAVRNIGLALGEAGVERLKEWRKRIPELERRVFRCETDGKLDRYEWLRMPDGRLLKSDALDHCEAHDLIGCQDVAWDVAGASVEFDLDASETAYVAAEVGLYGGRAVDPELLEFLTLAYLAFRLGQTALGAELESVCAADRRRLGARQAAYEARLSSLLLQQTDCATRHESWTCAVG